LAAVIKDLEQVIVAGSRVADTFVWA
jgi:hypothetical protein